MRTALAAAALLLALAGCRTVPPPPAVLPGPGADAPWPQQYAALREFNQYSLAGRVAVAASNQGFSGSLRYEQRPAQADLAIDGPLGMGGMRVVVAGDTVSITNSRGENLDGNAAREEIERGLGFALPLDHLRWWLLGVPAPEPSDQPQAPRDPEADKDGFDQQGWQVIVGARAPALGFSLPQRLTIEREGARLKLIVDRWQ